MNLLADELPEGWTETTLSTIGVWRSGGTPSRTKPVYFGGKIPWVKSGDLRDNVVLTSDETITDEGIRNSAAKLLSKGSVCVALYGATIGRAGILGIDAATNQACATCTVDSNIIENRFLFHYLISQRRQFIAAGQGGAQPNLTNEIVRNWPLSLPPLPEQRRIVAKIEALQSRSRKTREALEAIPPLLEQFRQSVLAAAFRGDLTADWREQHPEVEPASVLLDRIRTERRRKWEEGELTKFKAKGKLPKDDSWKDRYVEPEPVDETDLPELPEGWCWASVDELSVVITSGSRDWTQYYGTGTGTFVMAQNIRPGKLDFSGGRQLVGPPDGDRDRARSQILRGDLLITIVGANTGDLCGVIDDFPDHYVCQSVAIVRLADISRQGWVMRYFLSGGRGRKQLDEVIYGQGRPHLGFVDLRRMAVPIPPVAEQEVLLSLVSIREKSMDTILNVVESTAAISTHLDQSILAKAFRGELVPQDPNDEPALKLLERIQSERADDTIAKPARGRRKRTTAKAND